MSSSLLTILILFIGIVILSVGAIFLKKLKAAGGDETSPGFNAFYQMRSTLLSPAERSFFGVLQTQLPEGVSCAIKVRLGDVFTTIKGLERADRTRAWNRINQKHVDFLLFRESDLRPLAGIELDDTSHEKEERQQRDAFVDSVFQSCKIPLLHVKARETYNPQALRESVESALADTNQRG